MAANTPTVCEESEWWQVALTGNDQLRQRVAFALSELFVISSDSVNATTITYYHNTLANDAFTNFATIMQMSRSRRGWAPISICSIAPRLQPARSLMKIIRAS